MRVRSLASVLLVVLLFVASTTVSQADEDGSLDWSDEAYDYDDEPNAGFVDDEFSLDDEDFAEDYDDYDDDWDWEDETSIDLDDTTDAEYFDDLSAESMCALGNASDANNSLADAYDAATYAEYCADTNFAELIDTSLFKWYKNANGTGFYVNESAAEYCKDMPELDGCANVANATDTNATAINVIKGFINDAAKPLPKNMSMAKLFGTVAGVSLIKNITNATLINQTAQITGDQYHLWAIRVTYPDDYFITQRFGASFVSGYVKGKPGYFLVHAKVSKIAGLKDDPIPFLVDVLPMPYQLRVEPFSADVCKQNRTNCHVLDVTMLGITSFNQATAIAKTFKKGLAAAGHNVTVRVSSSIKIVVKAGKNRDSFDVKKVSTWLAKQQKVDRISVGSQYKEGGRPATSLLYSGADSKTIPDSAIHKLWADGTLAGQGEIIHLGDSGLRVEHCWFSDDYDTPFGDVPDYTARKVIAYGHNANSDKLPDLGKTDHGTHCAGMAVGSTAGMTSVTASMHTGTAWKAKIAFYDIAKNGDSGMNGVGDSRTEYLPWIKKMGAFISSNSWGGSIDINRYSHNGFNSYDSKSIDEWSLQNDNVLVLVANGNDGEHGLFSSGDPANCKNCLSVGAANEDGKLGDYSSRGPTADGRIKPDVVGVGTAAISADSQMRDGGYCATAKQTGTSQATPSVAGTLAVLRQALKEGYFPTGEPVAANANANPSAALMKALLVNGAEPVQYMTNDNGDQIPLGTVPSPYQGWGFVRMDQTIPIKGNDHFPSQLWDRQKIFNGEEVEFELNFEPGAIGRELCVTLVWWDAVTKGPTKKALVNDLDLTLLVGGKQIAYYPNGLAGPDRLNTVERVCIRTTGAPKESYVVVVKGASVTSGSQKFALVASSKSVADRKKPLCKTDVCNDLKLSKSDATTISGMVKAYWDDYVEGGTYGKVELCEYTTKAACAAKTKCLWCSVGGAGRCHKKALVTESMCPGQNLVTPNEPTTDDEDDYDEEPSGDFRSYGARSRRSVCRLSVKNNNCKSCAKMTGCNWCTYGDGRSGCLSNADKGNFTCKTSVAQCPVSSIPPGIKIALSPVAAIKTVVSSPPPPSPPPVGGSALDKLNNAREKFNAAKKLAEEKRNLATQKKAAADTKKAAARAKIEELAKKVTDSKQKVKLRVIAGAKAAGVKMKRYTAPVEPSPDTASEACKFMCFAAKVDCDNEVLCQAAAQTTRHLLATTYITSLTVNPDVTTAKVEENLKAQGSVTTIVEVTPNMDDLSGVLSSADLTALKTETAASETAAKEAAAAEAVALEAEKNQAAAQNQVTAAAALVSPPPPALTSNSLALRSGVATLASLFAFAFFILF